METNTAGQPVIEFRGVSYEAPGGQRVLCDLEMDVQRGETLVLLGRSGSGKTTTLKLVNRLLSPSSGEVWVNGAPIRDADVIRLRRGIGYVIQDVGLFPHFTVERNIGLVPELEGWPADRIRARVRGTVEAGGARRGSGLALPAPAFRRAEAARWRGPRAGCRSCDPVDGRTLRRARSHSPATNCSGNFWNCSADCTRRSFSSPMICARRCGSDRGSR